MRFFLLALTSVLLATLAVAAPSPAEIDSRSPAELGSRAACMYVTRSSMKRQKGSNSSLDGQTAVRQENGISVVINSLVGR